jgi:hypothetical protein
VRVSSATPWTASVGHRATLPNLPGRWLHVEDGTFRGRWLRESPRAHLLGESEWASYDDGVVMVMRRGRHAGYRFDADGSVTASRSTRLDARATARIDGRRIVNGKAYLQVVSGTWAGYLVRESRRAFRPGTIERMNFPDLAPVILRAGTYTGYRYARDGDLLGRTTATLRHSSRVSARAWAVINGVPHFRISEGTWAGTWVPETADVRIGT